jgi:predicted AAA+ superfamily ATPase
MYIKRSVTPLITDYLKLFPCVVLLGPRQAGKTTLLSQLGESWQRYDLELRADFDQISADPDLFLRTNTKAIAIDEAQLLPGLFPALRVAIDRDRSRMGRFVLTGSSSPTLLKSVSESLAGRAAVIDISPLSFHEIAEEPHQFCGLLNMKASIHELMEHLQYKSSIQKTHDYWLKGGYPEPWVRGEDRFRSLWTEQYVRSYLERDVGRLFPGIDSTRFRLFLQTLASLSGSIINYSEVARSLSLSQPTVRDYFDIADGTFVWRKIPSFERDATKRIIKHPRGYYRDSGLLNHLLRINSYDDLVSHPSRGRLWEGVVIEEVIRGLQSVGSSFDYYYYRTAAGAEVDLVLEGSFGILPIEIKYGQSISLKELRGIRDFVSERKCKYGIVINNDEKLRLYDDKLLGVPFNAL